MLIFCDFIQVYVFTTNYHLKTCKVLGDLDPMFKVIVFYVGYLLNQWMDFLQTYIDVPLVPLEQT